MPFFRELALGLGACSASKDSIEYILTKKDGGNIAVLLVGGAMEAFYCKPGQYKIILNKRKGFIRLAMKTGTPLVPVISFGETDIFDQMDNPIGSRLRKVQEFIKKYVGLAFAVPLGRGLFQYDFGIVPKRKPITTLVGQPLEIEKNLNPTEEEINEVHKNFKQHLIKTFEEQKHFYVKNPDEIKLEFL